LAIWVCTAISETRPLRFAQNDQTKSFPGLQTTLDSNPYCLYAVWIDPADRFCRTDFLQAASTLSVQLIVTDTTLPPFRSTPTSRQKPSSVTTTTPTSGPSTAALIAAAGAPTPPPAPRPSITDYLTDGSLARLVHQLTQLTGVSIELRDARGWLITPASDPTHPWQILDDGPERACDPKNLYFPLKLSGETIGSLVIRPGDPSLSANAREKLAAVVELLASTSAELVGYEAEVRDRMHELQVLHKLGNMISRADSVERILSVALESALDVLGLDAGNIVLLKEDGDGVLSQDENDLQHVAWRNLSSEWLRHPQGVSKDRLFDTLALKGEIVISEDLLTDPRVLILDRIRQEGLVTAINAGLVFQSQPIGVMRLYAKSRRTFTEQDKRLLKSIADQVAVAIEQSRLLRLQQDRAKAQRQMELAADVQRRMLPRVAPTLPRLDVAAKYTPSLELGGDFYDLFELNGHLGIAIGDVSGKGVAAALLMSSVRASLRAYVQDLYDLDEVVARVNVAMCRDTHEREFSTLWYGVIDPAKLRLTYCSAGHEPPMVVRMPGRSSHRTPKETDIDELGVGGMAVGIDPHQRYQRGVFDLHARDVLLAYTDGIIDARSFTNERFGRSRLRQSLLTILTNEPDATATRIVELIQWELRKFAGLKTRFDDETMVVLRVGEKA
jgi:sigma-B regulation protein RsbU (phosphoserine phosphatase)